MLLMTITSLFAMRQK